MSSRDDSPSTLGLLLARHKAGDAAAVNEIILHCRERFQLLTRRMLGRAARVAQQVESGDVVNELVARLINTLRQKTFDRPAQFLRYAALTIRSNLIDLAKKRRPVPAGAVGSDTSSASPLDVHADTTNEPGKLAQWGEVHALIDRLSDEDRALFDLIYYQNLTPAEASELLGVPLTTLRTRWLNARVNFMRIFGNNPPF
jgi:RNA polymerase sigma factor (sigma-70 family)